MSMREHSAQQQDGYGSENANQLLSRGWVEFREGFPEAWNWAVFDFVESYHAVYNEPIIAALESLRVVWKPCECSKARFGAFAAEKLSRLLKQYGVAVFTPPPSVSSFPAYHETGPRFYVSITQAALKHFGTAPQPPLAISKVLLGHPEDQKGGLRIRGLGWALAPPGSDPQDLHSDIWGDRMHHRLDRVRYPHFLWKPDRNVKCTTQIVPGVFPEGNVRAFHYDKIQQVSATALLVDGEVLHRGGATSPTPHNTHNAPCSLANLWPSTLSVELCTPTGWKVWMAGVGGGAPKKVQHLPMWHMLRVHWEAQQCPAGHWLTRCLTQRRDCYCDKCAWTLAKRSTIFSCWRCNYTECRSCYSETQNTTMTDDLPLLLAPELPPFEWIAVPGLQALQKEQSQWEGPKKITELEIAVPIGSSTAWLHELKSEIWHFNSKFGSEIRLAGARLSGLSTLVPEARKELQCLVKWYESKAYPQREQKQPAGSDPPRHSRPSFSSSWHRSPLRSRSHRSLAILNDSSSRPGDEKRRIRQTLRLG
mmetsp:Transcript_128249/g.256134  ORF Transcript_128249/g.256134 Transcript_128249/m.256134 type:complete len:535 (-) Transcript_128249:15-1619(-)